MLSVSDVYFINSTGITLLQVVPMPALMICWISGRITMQGQGAGNKSDWWGVPTPLPVLCLFSMLWTNYLSPRVHAHSHPHALSSCSLFFLGYPPHNLPLEHSYYSSGSSSNAPSLWNRDDDSTPLQTIAVLSAFWNPDILFEKEVLEELSSPLAHKSLKGRVFYSLLNVQGASYGSSNCSQLWLHVLGRLVLVLPARGRCSAMCLLGVCLNVCRFLKGKTVFFRVEYMLLKAYSKHLKKGKQNKCLHSKKEYWGWDAVVYLSCKIYFLLNTNIQGDKI